MTNWLKRHYEAIMADWHGNKIGMGEAAARLTWLGFSPDRAWDILTKDCQK